MKAALQRAFHSFLTSGYPPEEPPEFLRRLRTLNLTGLVLMVFGLLWAGSFAAFDSWDICLALVLMTGAYGGALMALRWLRWPTVVSHVLVALLAGAVVLATSTTGGLVHSNEAFYFVVPVLAVFLLGAQGLVWAGVAAACMGVLTWLHQTGYAFANRIPEEDRLTDATLTWLTAMGALAGVAFLYDRSRRRMAGQILEAKERAEEANRAKTQFLANMSHEFRTPLNAVVGLTEVTLSGELAPEQRRHLEMVKSSALNLVGLVEDVLDVSRIEAGQLSLHLEPFAPRALVAELVEQFRFRAEQRGLALSAEFDPDSPELVRGDPTRVRQILANLVDNALKFTDRGGVVVRLSAAVGSGLSFAVQDTGIGIPAELHQGIFESFQQADATAARRHQGSGLGLAICTELADAMSGRIEVESQLGQGSLFTVWLPLGAVSPVRPPAESFKVLAAEDDRMGRELLVTILEGAGYQIDVVNNGSEAVDALGQGRYDLVLMDIQMPVMDGLEAVRQIRIREADGPQVPVVALTAHALDEERIRCFDAGMDDFVAKPIEPETLLGTLDRWLAAVRPGPARRAPSS